MRSTTGTSENSLAVANCLEMAKRHSHDDAIGWNPVFSHPMSLSDVMGSVGPRPPIFDAITICYSCRPFEAYVCSPQSLRINHEYLGGRHYFGPNEIQCSQWASGHRNVWRLECTPSQRPVSIHMVMEVLPRRFVKVTLSAPPRTAEADVLVVKRVRIRTVNSVQEMRSFEPRCALPASRAHNVAQMIQV